MNHAEARSHMPDYLEGDLDLTRRALLDAHLDGCSSCSRDFAEMRGTIALLRGLPDPEPPPFMADQIIRRIREGEGRFTVADRLRQWFGALLSPQVGLPATALGVGLMMATGVIDPDAFDIDALRGQVVPAPAVAQLERVPSRPETPTRWPEPVAQRTPDLQIQLPASSPSAPTRLAGAQDKRWPTRSVRNPMAARPLTVANAGAPVGPLSAFRTEPHAASDLDARLDALIARPASFAADFARRPIFEQEAILRSLAGHARDEGRDAELLEALRSVPDLGARRLASAFSAELRSLGPRTVMSSARAEETR